MRRFWDKIQDQWVYEIEIIDESSDTTEPDEVRVTFSVNPERLLDVCEHDDSCPICKELRRRDECQSSEENTETDEVS